MWGPACPAVAPTPSDEIMANGPCPPTGLVTVKLPRSPQCIRFRTRGLCGLASASAPHLPHSQWCGNTRAQAACRSCQCFCNQRNPRGARQRANTELDHGGRCREFPPATLASTAPAGTALSARPGSLPEASHQPHSKHLSPSRHRLAVTPGTGHTLAGSPVVPAHPVLLSPGETRQTSSLAWPKMPKDTETRGDTEALSFPGRKTSHPSFLQEGKSWCCEHCEQGTHSSLGESEMPEASFCQCARQRECVIFDRKEASRSYV